MYRLQQTQTNFVFPPIVQKSSVSGEEITSYFIRNACRLRIHYNSIFVYLDKNKCHILFISIFIKKKKLKKWLVIA